MTSEEGRGHASPGPAGTDHGRRGRDARPPRRLNVPGFITDEEVGLGDLVARATYAVGIRPCGACRRRAAALNRWVTVTPRRPG